MKSRRKILRRWQRWHRYYGHYLDERFVVSRGALRAYNAQAAAWNRRYRCDRQGQ